MRLQHDEVHSCSVRRVANFKEIVSVPCPPHMSSYVLICPHMSSYVLICPHMSSYVLRCPHMSSDVLSK